uniref:Ovule protein n=1 Tax=Caenorhabditis tropicalis TaxID=1561998 RepID=A0A1I7T468_9PELO
MPVLPYKLLLDMSERVVSFLFLSIFKTSSNFQRPPMNPCLDLVSACNFESMDSYEVLRSENPFLFV